MHITICIYNSIIFNACVSLIKLFDVSVLVYMMFDLLWLRKIAFCSKCGASFSISSFYFFTFGSTNNEKEQNVEHIFTEKEKHYTFACKKMLRKLVYYSKCGAKYHVSKWKMRKLCSASLLKLQNAEPQLEFDNVFKIIFGHILAS